MQNPTLIPRYIWVVQYNLLDFILMIIRYAQEGCPFTFTYSYIKYVSWCHGSNYTSQFCQKLVVAGIVAADDFSTYEEHN